MHICYSQYEEIINIYIYYILNIHFEEERDNLPSCAMTPIG